MMTTRASFLGAQHWADAHSRYLGGPNGEGKRSQLGEKVEALKG